MHTILVCGAPWCDLSPVQQLLAESGVAAPVAAQSGEVASIEVWYERFFGTQADAHESLRVSKAWEMAASQIYLSNWAAPVWGWGDARSTWLLEFWRDFDARNCFVLLYQPAHRAVARALANQSAAFDPGQVLDEWTRYHAELLRFYNRNAQRCVFVDADQALTRPDDFAAALNRQFALDLRAPAQGATQPVAAAPLDLWLAQQYLRDYPAVVAVEQELIASVPGLFLGGQQAVTPALQTAVTQLRELYRDGSAAQAAQQAMAQQFETERVRQEQLTDEWSRQHKLAEQECRQQEQRLSQQIQLLKQDSQRQERDLHDERQRHQQAWLAHDALRAGELDEVVQQLHGAQEALEAALDREERFRARNPRAIQWEAVERLAVQGVPPSWAVRGLITADGALPPLLVVLTGDASAPAIVIDVPAGAAGHGWRGAPLSAVPSASAASPAGRALSQLSTRDFNVLRAVCLLLSREIMPHADGHNEFRQIFAGMLAALEQRPQLRYDAVLLQEERLQDDYAHLGIVLENAQFGDRGWPRFEFRLAAAQLRSPGFSALPRLQFPAAQGGERQFAQWFAESEDDAGPKFELRFDTDNKAIDIGAWNTLNRSDQLQFLSLLVRLPEMLQALAERGVQIRRDWKDWSGLAAAIVNTLRVINIPLKGEQV